MIAAAAITVGVLFAASLYMLLSRNSQFVVVGFLLLSNAANLLVLTASGLPDNAVAPLVDGAEGPSVDPLPQAFLLTAIVIGLGAAAFLLELGARIRREVDTDILKKSAEESAP